MLLNDILNNASLKTGLTRVSYDASKVPTSASNVTILPFFGDYRSTIVLSTMLLNRYREEQKAGRYFILCSWAGMRGLFPYVDEYWEAPSEMMASLFPHAAQFVNSSEMVAAYHRTLNQFFADVVDPLDFIQYYNYGLTNDFMKVFRHIKLYMPPIPSSVVLGNEFNKEMNSRAGMKIYIQPTTHLEGWKEGKPLTYSVSPNFWTALCLTLTEQGWMPVVEQGNLCYDMSQRLGNRVIYCNQQDLSQKLAAIRTCDIVLDVFNGTARLAWFARVPYLSCDERNRYSGSKEFELEDILAENLPRNHVFSFPTIATNSEEMMWKPSLFECIIPKLEKMRKELDKSSLPSSGEIDKMVPYSVVRKKQTKRFGTRFIRIPHL